MISFHRIHRSFLILLCIPFLSGCELFTADQEEDISIQEPIERRELPRALSNDEQAIALSTGEFGFDLMNKLVESESDENHFISPLSILMAYGMVMNGAEGETWNQMQEVFRLEGMNREQVNQAGRNLIDLLTDFDESVRFDIANSIWYRDTFMIEEDFLNTNHEYFDAEINPSDFNDPETVDLINQWVNDKTESRIEEIVDKIDPLSVMFLINAIYFNGDWTVQFDPDNTTKEPFHRPDGTIVNTDMMKLDQVENMLYTQGENYQAVNLYYGNAGFAMTVVLPEEGTDLQSWLSETDLNDWQNLTGNFTHATLTLEMPKFELEYEIDNFKDVLIEMGIVDAFAPELSDFSRINPEFDDLHISDTRHKTFIRVDEEGTEAAAVTSVEVGVVSAPQPVNIRLDRPFLYVIREVESGTILFMGSMTDPENT